MLRSENIKKLIFEAGFDLCGIASPERLPEAEKRYREWLDDGFHGEMDYLARDPERRTNLHKLMPEVRSVIVTGLNYYLPSSDGPRPGHGRVSRYARGRDYHKVIAAKTRRFLRSLHHYCRDRQIDTPNCYWYVDYGPVMERAYAEQAGLGFIGKNGMLINKEYGSWFFLSEILIDSDLDPDRRDPLTHGHCGSCRLCIETCPTQAIVGPRRIDSRKCISYLTIERPSSIPDTLAEAMGDLIFGCDICQEVCPYNQTPKPTEEKELTASHGIGEWLSTKQVLSLQSRKQYLELTAGTPLTRPRLENLCRNARIVSENERR